MQKLPSANVHLQKKGLAKDYQIHDKNKRPLSRHRFRRNKEGF